MGERHVHVLTNSQLLRVKQLALWRLKIAGESIQTKYPSLLAVG